MPQYAAIEEPFELVIRLQQFKAEGPLDGTFVRAQALVKDVLLSKLRVDAVIDAEENMRAEGFTDLSKVLAASRALQIAFEGFRDASSAGHSSIAMVLDSPPVVDPDISSISPPMQDSDLVTSAKPSQVLITRRFYNRVPYCHSVLRPLPIEGDVYEFLWTNEQKLHEMQAETASMPAHVKEPAPAPELIETVVPQPSDSVIPEPPVESPDWQNSEVAREPAPAGLDPSVRRTWLSGRRIVALSAGVVVVMLLGWLLHSYVFVNKPATATPETPKRVDATPPTTTPTPPSKPQSAGVATKPAYAAPTPKVAANPLSTLPPPGVSPKTPRKSHTCAIDGPIPAFLRRAEADSSSGRYDSAIRRFTEILECEPGNREAAQELQKAKDSQKYAP